MERIKLNKEQYDLLMSKYLFNEKKNEKLILEMSLKGYTIKDISNIVNVSERTVYRRLNVLINKINYFLNENDMLKNNYYVYIHTFPNNKVYIGITNDLKQRWKSGLGYQDNAEMFKDILYYGWNNINHNVLAEGLTYNEAIKLENIKIIEYKSYNKKYGYNIRVDK